MCYREGLERNLDSTDTSYAISGLVYTAKYIREPIFDP